MKKIIALVLALTLALSLAACGGSSDDKTIKVGATPAPHAEILEVVKKILADEGYDLQIVEFDDYVILWKRASWMPTTSSTSPT